MADLPPSSRATRLTVSDASSLDALARPRRAREGDHVDAGVGGDGLARRLPGAGDQVEHAGRQADLVDDLGEDEGAERRDLARLEDDRATRRQRRGHLGGDLVERVVPGGDGADDADRLPDDERVADRLLPGDLVDQIGQRRRS